MAQLDESFDWAPRVIEHEIPDAIARALHSGATPPLSFAGAGMYGIVICDRFGKAFKVARHWPRGNASASLQAEAQWFKFASQFPQIRDHVARVHQYDPSTGVLVRECVLAVQARRLDWTGKRDRRRLDLLMRINAVMRPYGFRTPEYKEDSFVYHPTRGPVLVDASFGVRDIGWANARRARQLLQGDRPTDDFEPQAVAHGLRMDAGTEIPAELADELAWKLDRRFSKRNGPRGRHAIWAWPNYAPDMFPKKCLNCGRIYHQSSWQRLRLLGPQSFPWGEVGEFRNCPCGTTLYVVVTEGDPED